MVGFSASTLVYRRVWRKTKTESHYLLVIFCVKITFSGVAEAPIYTSWRHKKSVRSPGQRWPHKAYRQLAPKPLLRQLKRRPMRPHRSLWRNSLENLSAGRDTAAGCHMFSYKRLINQQRPLSAVLLIPELENLERETNNPKNKHNQFHGAGYSFFFVFREWSLKSIQYDPLISIDIHSLVDEAQDSSNISEIALRIC